MTVPFGLPVPISTTTRPTEPTAVPFGVPTTVDVTGIPVPREAVTARAMKANVTDPSLALMEMDLDLGQANAILRGIGVAVAETAKDVAAAFRLGSGIQGPDPEILAEFRSDPEFRAAALRGVAFTGAVALDIALGPVTLAAAPIVAATAKGGAVGALYGLLRPKEDGESIVAAIGKDAALFGGINLGFSLFGGAAAFRRPVAPLSGAAAVSARKASRDLAERASQLGLPEAKAELIARNLAETGFAEVPRAAVVLPPGEAGRIGTVEAVKRAKALVTPEEFERRVLELAAKRGTELQPLEQAAVVEQTAREIVAESGHAPAGIRAIELLADAERTGGFTIVEHPRDLFPYGRFVAPPHTWRRIHPTAGAIVDNAIERRLVQEQVRREWGDLIERTEKALTKPERIELGTLLDSHVRGDQLPTEVPAKLVEWFGQWRSKLDVDRKALQQLLGADAGWGIDAYYMHVFVGDWRIVDAANNKALPGFAGRSLNDAVEKAREMLAAKPDLAIRIEPNRFTWENDAATALGTKAYFRFVSAAADALRLEADEVKQLLKDGRVTRPASRQKFFGHTQHREAQLEGFVADPIEAARIYSFGLGRKLAFHDFEQQALRSLEQIPPELPSLRDALKSYISRVLGRPTADQIAWNAMVKWASQTPGLRSMSSSSFSLSSIAQNVRKFESLWRLGYSPISAFVNLSQTFVNTASKIGYRDTAAAVAQWSKALVDEKAAARIDGLLSEMGVEFNVPLAAVNIYKDTMRVSWWKPLYMFNKAETVNRGIASLAGYERAIARGASHSQAITAGKQLSRDMNFVYSVEDLPAILSGPVGQTLGQFKPFLINELHFVAGLRGAEIPRFVTNIIVAGGIGGLLSLPPLALVNWAVGATTGETLVERAEKRLPRAARGALGAVGIDVSQNVAIGGSSREVLDISLGPGARDMLVLARDVLPAAAKKLILQQDGVLSREDRIRITRQLAPVMARRLFDAYSIQARGVVRQPTTGRPIFTPQNATAEALWTALGARTLARAEAERELTTTRRIAEQHIAKRRSFIDRVLQARRDGNVQAEVTARRQAMDDGIVITNDMIQRARDERAEEVQENVLERLPKRLRSGVRARTRSKLPQTP